MKLRNAGFTILEVLVSISIILILAGLLMAVFGKAKSGAKMTVSISNLRQIHQAAMLYEADFGTLPPSNIRHPAFLPYLGGQVLRSPAATRPPPEDDYFLVGHFSDAMRTLFPADYHCSIERGSEYVLAYDLNYSRSVVGKESGGRWYLLVRRNGSAKKIPAAAMDQFDFNSEDYPCPEAQFWSNF